MKKTITLLYFLFFLGASIAQQASDYFPSQTGFEWKFKATPLDSASNPIPELAFFRVDSFATIDNYKSKLANIVLTKTGSIDSIVSKPFLDSIFYHIEGTTGFEYFNVNNIREILYSIDTAGYFSNFSFVDFFTSLQNWYDNYRFASPVGTVYTLLQKDTTIYIGVLSVPFSFKYLGTRLDDQNIHTVLGNFDCKKFLIQWKVSANILFQEYQLITTYDTIWIAPNNWIVQDIIPGQYIQISIPPFLNIEQAVPGLDTRLTDEIVSVKNEESIPMEFSLSQNYPNPFNPSTSIQYAIGSRQFVSIKVYDILGNEIETLFTGEKTPGNYNVEFDGTKLPSGIYFYQLKAGDFVNTKKMILIK